METCFRCGISSERTILYDAISSEGLVKICSNCNIRENFPILKKSGAPPGEKRQTVYERLSTMSGFNQKERELHRKEEAMKKPTQADYDALGKKIVNDFPWHRDEHVRRFAEKFVILLTRRNRKKIAETIDMFDGQKIFS